MRINEVMYTKEKVKELLEKHLEETGLADKVRESTNSFLKDIEPFYQSQIDYLKNHTHIPKKLKDEQILKLNEERNFIYSIIEGKDQYKLTRYITRMLPEIKNDLQFLFLKMPEEFFKDETERKRLRRVKSILDAIHTSADTREDQYF